MASCWPHMNTLRWISMMQFRTTWWNRYFIVTKVTIYCKFLWSCEHYYSFCTWEKELWISSKVGFIKTLGICKYICVNISGFNFFCSSGSVVIVRKLKNTQRKMLWGQIRFLIIQLITITTLIRMLVSAEDLNSVSYILSETPNILWQSMQKVHCIRSK